MGRGLHPSRSSLGLMAMGDRGFKLAVAGKGGVGKTFISGTLARLLARDGYKVLAVDADPNINLASTLGIPREISERITPLSENDRLIAEKTGIPPGGSYGLVFRLTPRVDDIFQRFCVEAPDGVRLLVMGTVKGGDTGCMCPANALLRVLMQHLLLSRGEVVVMDMVAGLEHLGRGTAKRVDSMLVVIEPTLKSIETLRRIVKLAREIEIPEVLAVANKLRGERSRRLIEREVGGIPIAAYIPYDTSIEEAELLGVAPLDHDENSPAVEAVRGLKEYLKERYGF